ncbi:hypothetical protein SDC9_140719 [bioreactor metagenome]|uniref:Uncharacterized protein n=1 Tax=bioreactor metagenome TaxID=1076179 RepID=A0A645DWB5_9ZZZZ
MHGHVLGGSGVTVELHDHADARAVQVGSQVGAVEALEATERHVFADLADQALADVFQRGAKAVLLIGQCTQGFHRGGVVQRHQLGCGVGHGDKAVVLGNEVGFAVGFHQRAHLAVHESGDHAFSSDTRGSLACLGAELDAQQLFSLGHIAISFGQSLLAFHHGGVGLGAQFSDHACSNCHRISPVSVRFVTGTTYANWQRHETRLCDTPPVHSFLRKSSQDSG